MAISRNYEHLSLEWSRMLIYNNTRLNHDPHEALLGLYNSLINKDGYVLAKNKNGILKLKSVDICYGDRTTQRRRAYEIIELIRDTIYHRTIQYGPNIYTF